MSSFHTHPGGWRNQWGHWIQSDPQRNSPLPRNTNYRFAREETFVDNCRGISEEMRQEVNVSPRKYEVKETRKLTVNSPHKPEKPKQKAIQNADYSPHSLKVKMDVRLEKFDDGVVCVTKVKFDGRVRWQNVKETYWDLCYHPALVCKKTVERAVNTMKKYKTLQISLTDTEALPYKRGQLLEGAKANPRAKNNIQIIPETLNISYETHNHFYNGPSTSSFYRTDSEEEDD